MANTETVTHKNINQLSVPQAPPPSSASSIPQQLPVLGHKADILQALEHNDIIIICAETGAGKTTQVPQMCAEAGYRVFCCQPTRIAVESIQSQVEQQFGGHNGSKVGFQHGQKELLGDDFQIAFCSDGLLFKKILGEEYLKSYDASCSKDVLIIDECHIFNQDIEGLLALYKLYRPSGNVPKLVVMSATVSADEIARFFHSGRVGLFSSSVPTLEIPGRQFEVMEREPGESLIQDVAACIQEAQNSEHGDRGGNIMVFFPGVGEIDRFLEKLRPHHPDVDLVALHGGLSLAQQHRALEETGRIKVIATTNVAETSLTVPGVRFVINAGLVRYSTNHDDRVPLESDETILVLAPNSRGEAKQRQGRAGRIEAGVYYNHGESPEKLPLGYWAMQHSPLHRHFLGLIVGGEDPITLRYVHDPTEDARLKALDWLVDHGFIDSSLRPTALGYFAASLPVDPREAKMLFNAHHNNQLAQQTLPSVITIAAIMGVRDFRLRGTISTSAFESVDESLHGLMTASDNLANLCVLERIYREDTPDKRTKLCECLGVREDAAKEVEKQREEIATRLGFALPKLGTQNLTGIPLLPLLEVSASGWSDKIYRYVGSDQKMRPLYRAIDDDQAPLRTLNRYSLLRAPNLVTGKPFSIGLTQHLSSEKDVLRLITQASMVPRSWLENNLRLAQIDQKVAAFRTKMRREGRYSERSLHR